MPRTGRIQGSGVLAPIVPIPGTSSVGHTDPFDPFGVHASSIYSPLPIEAVHASGPFPFQRSPINAGRGQDMGAMPANIVRSRMGQAGRLARRTFYAFASPFNGEQGLNNPASDQVELGYTEPLQDFRMNVRNPRNRPSGTDSGVNVAPGIKSPLSTGTIATAMPWQSI